MLQEIMNNTPSSLAHLASWTTAYRGLPAPGPQALPGKGGAAEGPTGQGTSHSALTANWGPGANHKAGGGTCS